VVLDAPDGKKRYRRILEYLTNLTRPRKFICARTI